jgi:hypothetical protein
MKNNAQWVGIAESPSAVVIMPNKGLLKKDVEFKVSYSKGTAAVIESIENFSLLFLQK